MLKFVVIVNTMKNVKGKGSRSPNVLVTLLVNTPIKGARQAAWPTPILPPSIPRLVRDCFTCHTFTISSEKMKQDILSTKSKQF